MKDDHKKFVEAAKARFAQISTLDMMVETRKLMNDHRDGVILVFSLMLDELERRLPESVFIEFCDRLGEDEQPLSQVLTDYEEQVEQIREGGAQAVGLRLELFAKTGCVIR